MADARPPPAAETPSASALMGSYPIDEDALRKLKRLHDDGVIDDDEFKRGKLEALGLAEPTASLGALSPLPEDVLCNVLSFLVVTRDDIATCFLENMRKTRREARDLSREDEINIDDIDDHARCVRNLLRAGTDGAKKIASSILMIRKQQPPHVLVVKNSLGALPVPAREDFKRLFWKLSSPELDDRALELKWRSLVREFEEMMNEIYDLEHSDFWALGYDISSFISRLEAAHLKIIYIMLTVDGLDFSFADEIAAYDFLRFQKRNESESSDDDSDDSA